MNSLVASQKKDLTKGGDFNAAVSPTIHVSDIATFAVQYSKDELNNNPGTIPCTVCACFPHKSGVDRSACIFLAACFLAVQLCANADVPAASHISLVPAASDADGGVNGGADCCGTDAWHRHRKGAAGRFKSRTSIDLRSPRFGEDPLTWMTWPQSA